MIAIKNVTAPETCGHCMFQRWSNLAQTGYCDLKREILGGYNYREYIYQKPDWCPIVEISDKVLDLDKVLAYRKPVKPEEKCEEWPSAWVIVCPTCGEILDDQKYCPECGQALDWEAYEEEQF